MVCPFKKRDVSANFLLGCDIIECYKIEQNINDDLEHFER